MKHTLLKRLTKIKVLCLVFNDLFGVEKWIDIEISIPINQYK